MWEDEGSLLRLLYVNDNVFVWQRGAQSLFVVKSGLGYQSSIPINSSAILKGTNVCLVEQDGTGVRAHARHTTTHQHQPVMHSFALPTQPRPSHGPRGTGSP